MSLKEKKKLFIILLLLFLIIPGILFIYYQIFIFDPTPVTTVDPTVFGEHYISEADKMLLKDVPDHYDFKNRK